MEQAERTTLALALLDTADALRDTITLVRSEYTNDESDLLNDAGTWPHAANVCVYGIRVLDALEALALHADKDVLVEHAKTRVAEKRAARRAAQEASNAQDPV